MSLATAGIYCTIR